MNHKQTAGGGRGLRLTAISAALVAAFTLPNAASAFEFDIGNEDVVIRWDNTVRLNLVQRIAAQDEAMLKNPNYDDGNRNFSRGKVFTRFDVLSEFDVVYKKTTGFRVSAAGWWDPSYNSLDNTSVQTSNHLVNGRPALGLPDYTDRYARGGSGEFLDVFGFTRFEVAGAPVTVRLGQTTVFWGESLLFNGAVTQRRVLAEPDRRLEGPVDSGRGGEGTLPSARRPEPAGAGVRRLVGRGPVLLQLAEILQSGLAPSGVGLVPHASGRTPLGRRVADHQRRPARSASGAAPTSRRKKTPATGAWRRAGAPTGSTARWARTTARPTT